MRYGEYIKGMAKRRGKGMGELAKDLGISRQALYKRLRGDMLVSHFSEMVEVLGGEVRVVEDGKARKVE